MFIMNQDLSSSGIALPVSSPPVLPRLDGDGMDNETMRSHSTIQQIRPSSRHKNLNQEFNSVTTSSKVNFQDKKSVPREPVKGAVKPLVLYEKSNSSLHMKHVQSVSSLPEKKHLLSQSSTKDDKLKTIRKSLTFDSSLSSCSANGSKGNVYSRSPLSPAPNLPQSQTSLPPQYNSNAYVKSNKSLEINELQCDDWNRINFTLDDESITKQQNTSNNQNSYSVIDMTSAEKSELETVDYLNEKYQALDMDEDRNIEGGVEENVTREMKAELDDVKSQLEVQYKVNADLKKLLVASVGDDMHYKVEAIVRTKAQLAREMYGYDKKQKEDYEDLDNLSIQADMWRSKFSASRLLIDQLSKERDSLSDMRSSCLTALQQLMAERLQLHDDLRHTHRYLKLLRDSFDPLSARKTETTIPNLLELARTNLRLADAVKFRLLNTAPIIPVVLDAAVQNGLSPAERLAYQILENAASVKTSSQVLPATSHLSPQQLQNGFMRFHPNVRVENVTFDCCRKCGGKGELHVV